MNEDSLTTTAKARLLMRMITNNAPYVTLKKVIAGKCVTAMEQCHYCGYAIGAKFKVKNECRVLMLCRVDVDKVGLITIEDKNDNIGNRWSTPVQCESKYVSCEMLASMIELDRIEEI